MPAVALMNGVEFLLQDTVTTGNGNAAVVLADIFNLVVIARGTGTISGGTISIEEAHDPNYTGTWSVITTINGTDLTGGAAKAVHISGLVRAIRARISSNITGGGTVTVGATVGH